MTNEDLARRPPTDVRRRLRQEVGFGCPVEGCGNPYLEYHHFDPPWEVERHHDPDRMVALCATHHAKAGAWLVQDLRRLKRAARDQAAAGARPGVIGRFDWMREDVLAVVGGNYYYETPKMVVFRDEPLIWFERDESNRLLLSMRMLTTSGQPRTSLDRNDWLLEGDPQDVDSPPNGSFLRVRYGNGDDVSIQFKEWRMQEKLEHAHPTTRRMRDDLTFPLVTCEVNLAVGGTDLRFGPNSSHLGGITMTGGIMIRCGAGLAFG